MKVKMKRDAHHRISAALSQHYRDGGEYTVPKAIGQALIEQGAAEPVPAKSTSGKE